MFQAPPDIPLSLGDLVGISFRTYRERARTVIPMFLVPTILATVCVAVLRWTGLHYLNTMSWDIKNIGWHLAIVLLCFILIARAQWDLSLTSVAVTRLAIGIDGELEQAMKYARRRSWAALLIYSLSCLIPVVVVVFWALLMVGAFFLWSKDVSLHWFTTIFFAASGLLGTITLCWSLSVSALAFSILACEDIKLGDVFLRTMRFSARYLWRGGSYMVLLGITLSAIIMAIDLPVTLLSIFDAIKTHTNPMSSNYEVPMYLQVVSGIWDSAINLLLLALVPIAMSFFYHDLCLRDEGRDISLRLEKLESPSPVGK